MDEVQTALAIRAERASALDMALFASELAVVEPSRGSLTFPLAGGHVSLCGPGMFVNAALAVGFDTPLDAADLQLLDTRAAQVGVTPVLEVSELSSPSLVELLTEQGWQPDDATAGLILTLTGNEPEASGVFEVTAVDDDALLREWQAATALGWGHSTEERRAASDAFGAVAAATQEPGLLLVRDPANRQVVGCASLSFRDGVATLGGMSTIPAARNRGLQRQLIDHRLHLAAQAGCDVAATQADPTGGSRRNLVRAGFTHTHTKIAWMPGPAAP
jgi:GNAT superfamily N-acetyltransferase